MNAKNDKKDNMRQFEDFANRAMATYHVPGTSIAVIKDGKITYVKGLGYRDIEHKLPVTPETIFAIGSCTKAFTATALGMLVDQGKLNWDTPIKEYFPDFAMYDKEATEHLSLRDCLCHRSGLPLWGYDSLWIFDGWRNHFKNRTELVANLRYLKPSAGFREKFQYNNFTYVLAGYILEIISKMPWDVFVQRYITQPLGMRNTYFSALVVPSHPNAALAYEFDKTSESFSHVDYTNTDLIAPAGSMHSNVFDMAQWVIMNLQNRIINDEIHRPQILLEQAFLDKLKIFVKPNEKIEYCLGWFKTSNEHLWHSGGLTGCSAWVSFTPNKQAGVIVLSNIRGVRRFNNLLAKYAYACIIGVQDVMQECEVELLKVAMEIKNDKERSLAKKIPFQYIRPDQALRFVGTYQNAILNDFTISACGSAIKGTWFGGIVDLECIDENTLKYIGGNSMLRFKKNDANFPKEFELEIDKERDTCSYEFIQKEPMEKKF